MLYIEELSLEIIYYYGQFFSFTNRKMFVLDDIEINMLNEEGQVIISNTLPEMEREPLVIQENSFRYLEPDGELISDIFYKLVAHDNTRWDYYATSYLREGGNEYNAQNLSFERCLPWASANGYGIGDKIIIDMGAFPKNSITIINGFVSETRPDLFIANSRAQLIKLENLDNGKIIIISLGDSIKP